MYKFSQRVVGMLAEAEKEGFSYPLHLTVEMADGRRMTWVVYGDRNVIAGPRLLPAMVEVREWNAATGKPKEERALRTEIHA